MNDNQEVSPETKVSPIRAENRKGKDFLWRIARLRFSDIEKYLESIDATGAALKKELDMRIARSGDADEFDVIEEQLFVEQTLPDLHSRSVFLLSHTAFEAQLFDFCGIAVQPTNLNVKDMEGRGVWQARNFLEKVCGVTTSFQSVEWQEVEILGKIRNSIVHSLFIDLKPGLELKRKASHMPGIEFSKLHHSYSITLSREFAVFANARYQSALANILAEIHV